MFRLVLAAATLAAIVVTPLGADAASSKLTKRAYVNYSRAHFISICDRACRKPTLNLQMCCTCNGGDWTGRRCI
jgi:hypothetical protein